MLAGGIMKCSKQMLENIVIENQPTKVPPRSAEAEPALWSSLFQIPPAFCSIAWQLVAFPWGYFHEEFDSAEGHFGKVLSLC